MRKRNRLKKLIISLGCILHPDKKETTITSVTKNYVDVTSQVKKSN